MTAGSYLIGIDVGGTFTDVLAYDRESGRILQAKVPSFPGEQWRGVLDALAALGIEGSAVSAFVHGTTIATNALLERKGAKTGLVTTEGFRDVLEIGKTRRLTGGLFDAAWVRPRPIVERELRLEVPERVAADGTVLRAVSPDDLEQVADVLRGAGIETVAVCFLNSYRNDENEVMAVATLGELLSGIPVSQSTALVPERGEFERTSTCVLNAYLTPVMAGYLNTLTAALSERGLSADVNIMGSNGGAMTIASAAKRVAGTFLSGPVGGVTGVCHVVSALEIDDCITFDMGGTSTDVALIHDREPRMSHDNQIDAYPLQMPQLDIHTIGAGGGSIVHVQQDGTLEIGPQSAGAAPGPACYGRGGVQPTISDANLLLGRLPTDRALSGGLILDRCRAESAFQTIADALGVEDIIAVADSALRIAVAKMAGAVREVSVHRGFDPRDFALVGFGGAGPMHVFFVAEELAIPNVVIPRFPGHLSALGQMLADMRCDFVSAWGGRLSSLSVGALNAEIETLIRRATAALTADGIPAERHRHTVTLDMRYVGQSFTLPIFWSDGYADWTPLRTAFDARHAETFGYEDQTNDAEIVNLRLVSIGVVEKPAIGMADTVAEDPVLERRQGWFGDWIECPVYRRDALSPGFAVSGPAIVEEAGGTSVIPPLWRCAVAADGALVCVRGD